MERGGLDYVLIRRRSGGRRYRNALSDKAAEAGSVAAYVKAHTIRGRVGDHDVWRSTAAHSADNTEGNVPKRGNLWDRPGCALRLKVVNEGSPSNQD